MLTDSHHADQICSCTSCYYGSQSCNPSIQRMLRYGTKIDRLFLGKYIPLRERNLLKKLARTRAVYDNISCQLTAESSTCIDEKYFTPRQPCCNEMDFYDNPDLMDTCGTVYMPGAYSMGRICKSVRFTTKPIKSEPYTSTSKKSARKLRPGLQRFEHSVGEHGYRKGKKHKLKRSKSRLMQSEGKWSLRTEETKKEHKKAGVSKKNKIAKKTETKHLHVGVKRSTNTLKQFSSDDLDETSFSLRKDSRAKFKDELERRRRIYLIKLNKKYKPCKSPTPGYCLPGECDPNECCKKVESRHRKRREMGMRSSWYDHPHHHMRYEKLRDKAVDAMDKSQKENFTNMKSSVSSTSTPINEDKAISSNETLKHDKVGNAIPIRESISDESDTNQKKNKKVSSQTKSKKPEKQLTFKLKPKSSRSKAISTTLKSDSKSSKNKASSKSTTTQVMNKKTKIGDEDKEKKKLRLKHSQVSIATEKSAYNITKHKLRRCFCSLKLANRSSKEINSVLLGVDYGPYECDTELCDPNICLKFNNRLRTQHERHMNRTSTEYRKTKSTSSLTSKSNKPKKVQSNDSQGRKRKKKRTLRKVTATSSSPGRQRSNNFKEELKTRSSGTLKKPKQKERGFQRKVKKRKRSTSIIMKRKNRGSFIAPEPKECVCELRHSSSRNKSERGKKTSTQEDVYFTPYCDPYCDQYISLRGTGSSIHRSRPTITERSKLQTTSSFAHKTSVKSKGTATAQTAIKQRKKDSSRKAKRKKFFSPVVDLKIPRQTVRYGSNISFTIEFRKITTNKAKEKPDKNRNLKETEIYTVSKIIRKGWCAENSETEPYIDTVTNGPLNYNKSQPNLFCTLNCLEKESNKLLPYTLESACEPDLYAPKRCNSYDNEKCLTYSTLWLKSSQNHAKMKSYQQQTNNEAIKLIESITNTGIPRHHYYETVCVGSRISIGVELSKYRVKPSNKTLEEPTKHLDNTAYFKDDISRTRNKTVKSNRYSQGIKLRREREHGSLICIPRHRKCLFTQDKCTQSRRFSKYKKSISQECKSTQKDLGKGNLHVQLCNTHQMKQKSFLQKCFCWFKVKVPLNENFKVVEAIIETEKFDLIHKAKKISRDFGNETCYHFIDTSNHGTIVCIPNEYDKLMKSTYSRIDAKMSFTEKFKPKLYNLQGVKLFKVLSTPLRSKLLMKKKPNVECPLCERKLQVRRSNVVEPFKTLKKGKMQKRIQNLTRKTSMSSLFNSQLKMFHSQYLNKNSTNDTSIKKKFTTETKPEIVSKEIRDKSAYFVYLPMLLPNERKSGSHDPETSYRKIKKGKVYEICVPEKRFPTMNPSSDSILNVIRCPAVMHLPVCKKPRKITNSIHMLKSKRRMRKLSNGFIERQLLQYHESQTKQKLINAPKKKRKRRFHNSRIIHIPRITVPSMPSNLMPEKSKRFKSNLNVRYVSCPRKITAQKPTLNSSSENSKICQNTINKQPSVSQAVIDLEQNPIFKDTGDSGKQVDKIVDKNNSFINKIFSRHMWKSSTLKKIYEQSPSIDTKEVNVKKVSTRNWWKGVFKTLQTFYSFLFKPVKKKLYNNKEKYSVTDSNVNIKNNKNKQQMHLMNVKYSMFSMSRPIKFSNENTHAKKKLKIQRHSGPTTIKQIQNQHIRSIMKETNHIDYLSKVNSSHCNSINTCVQNTCSRIYSFIKSKKAVKGYKNKETDIREKPYSLAIITKDKNTRSCSKYKQISSGAFNKDMKETVNQCILNPPFHCGDTTLQYSLLFKCHKQNAHVSQKNSQTFFPTYQFTGLSKGQEKSPYEDLKIVQMAIVSPEKDTKKLEKAAKKEEAAKTKPPKKNKEKPANQNKAVGTPEPKEKKNSKPKLQKFAKVKKRKCTCGSKVCYIELKKQSKMMEKAETEPCVCNSPICVIESERRQVPNNLCECDLALLKRCRKACKLKKHQMQEAVCDEKRREAKKFAEYKRKQKQKLKKKAAKRDRLQVAKYKRYPDGTLAAESALDAVKSTVSIGVSGVKGIFRAVFNPKCTYYEMRRLFRDPNQAISRIQHAISNSEASKAANRIKNRTKAMKSVQELKHKIDSSPTAHYIFNIKKSEERIRFRRKPPFRKQMRQDFECSLFMASLRRRPCLHVYNNCPWFYPHCLSFLNAWRQCTDIFLFLLAVGVWSPFILAMEACRALLCCFFCTG